MLVDYFGMGSERLSHHERLNDNLNIVCFRRDGILSTMRRRDDT